MPNDNPTRSVIAPEIDIGGYLPARAARPAAPTRPAPAAPALSALGAALDRLEAIVGEETAALQDHRPIDLGEANRRKSQSLLEITRLARTLPVGGDPRLSGRLRQLREGLAANHRLLGVHLAAVREIADLMVGVLHEAESDGTYEMRRTRHAP